ncbi:hypothetical protein B0H17DRAFT_1141000 [Mycena rosella]|uniref:Uncharacterized protein n=1 Tax=Mycena rosella TaxID=1033263 RepID=A0AAD7G762_MYCRO|nr:hypothetical protein B0H17DRAFT_1141000 [Mycena rosella]
MSRGRKVMGITRAPVHLPHQTQVVHARINTVYPNVWLCREVAASFCESMSGAIGPLETPDIRPVLTRSVNLKRWGAERRTLTLVYAARKYTRSQPRGDRDSNFGYEVGGRGVPAKAEKNFLLYVLHDLINMLGEFRHHRMSGRRWYKTLHGQKSAKTSSDLGLKAPGRAN